MKNLLLVLGGGAILYGVILAVQKKKARNAKTATAVLTPEAVSSGPSLTSDAGSAVNGISPVQHYGYPALDWPMTVIQVPGPGSLDGIDSQNLHQKVSF
jgi:hypothetical protein